MDSDTKDIIVTKLGQNTVVTVIRKPCSILHFSVKHSAVKMTISGKQVTITTSNEATIKVSIMNDTAYPPSDDEDADDASTVGYV